MPIEPVSAGPVESEFRAYVAAREPAATEIAAALTSRVAPRDARFWAVRDGAGELCGALGISRFVRDRWYAHVHLDDLGRAAEVGALVDRLNVRGLGGPFEAAMAVSRHVSRTAARYESWTYAAPVPPAPMAPADFVASLASGLLIRRAGAGDVAAALDVYLTWPVATFAAPRLRLLREGRRRIEEGGTVVALADGEVVGIIQTMPRSTQFAIIDGLVVRPGRRATGIGLALMTYATLDTFGHGLGVYAIRLRRARIRTDNGTGVEIPEPARHLASSLHPLSVVRGHRRVVDVLDRWEDGLFDVRQRR